MCAHACATCPRAAPHPCCSVINPAGAPDAFQFEALLHTYLAIGKDNIEGVRIAGLAGTQYIDKMDAGATHDEAGAEVRITRETDRVYMAAPADVEVTGIVAQARAPVTRIIVHKTGTVRDAHMALRGVVVSAPLDVVVWNAWVDKCASIADFDPADYKSYVCIEPGRVSERTAHYAGRESLPPGKKFTLSQMLVLKREDAPATA
ncbi:hypothetical protein EON67_08060 [archaeon]|nr:MAG: hypothetical protein EON67_08060 [archaeon]